MGTCLVGFQKDQFGPDGGSAGVMSQVTLATKQGQLNQNLLALSPRWE